MDYPDNIPVDVSALFEVLALRLWDRGFRRYSARSILYQIRWHHHIERGDRAFKLNDHWSPTLSRWFLEKHPEMEKFFELRERIDDGYGDAA